jgi:hypothetical protein
MTLAIQQGHALGSSTDRGRVVDRASDRLARFFKGQTDTTGRTPRA